MNGGGGMRQRIIVDFQQRQRWPFARKLGGAYPTRTRAQNNSCIYKIDDRVSFVVLTIEVFV